MVWEVFGFAALFDYVFVLLIDGVCRVDCFGVMVLFASAIWLVVFDVL